MNQSLIDGLAFLADNGLNLAAILPVDDLPPEMVQALAEHDIDVHDYRRLVLLGHGGRRFWKAFSASEITGDHPIDRFSAKLATAFVADYLPDARWQSLFPSSLPLNLQQLGTLAGWSHPSPLGTGINRDFGVWFAYRAAFLTDVELPLLRQEAGESPCAACLTRDCISACPSQATGYPDQFDVYTCAAFRAELESPCIERCLARLACPYAPEHRYSNEQLAYHYRFSYRSIRRYMNQDRECDDA
jgi:epoxyqueuosine reductase